MKKVIFDTNVLIDWINDRRFEDLIFESGTAKYLSAVVLMELMVGASNAEDQKIIRKLHNVHRKAARMVTPSESNYADAGNILLKLQKNKGYDLKKSFSLVNDVLIALTARSIGAILFTQNIKDFQTIREIKAFDLEVL
ncbi:MAG: PIN domain-containing protein [Thermodesulfobacteriota bacterium]